MSIDQIPPQGAAFVYEDPDGNQLIEPDWYLFFYSLWITATAILAGGVAFPDAVNIAMVDLDAIGADVANSHGGGGGTGTVTHTTGALVNHALTGGSGATVDDIKSLALLTDGQLMVGATGADPAPQTMSGDATLSSLGVLTLNPLTVMTRGKVQAGFQMPMSY